MSQATELPSIDHLDTAARVELLGRVWDSLIESNGLPPTPEWHKREIARRIARADAEPGTGIPPEQLRRELLGHTTFAISTERSSLAGE